jgi:hypothetical protein
MVLADRIACAVFFVDMLVRWRRTGWAGRFWRTGWLDLLASIPFDAAFRTLQLFRVYRVVQILRTLYKLRELTSGTSFNEKLLAMPGVAFVMVLFSTNLMLEVEAGAPGATIRTGGDALWWALDVRTHHFPAHPAPRSQGACRRDEGARPAAGGDPRAPRGARAEERQGVISCPS